MKNIQIVLFFAFSLIFFSSCDSDDVQVQENQYLKSVELVGTLEKEAFKETITPILGEQGSAVLLFVQSGIKQYKITYETKDVYGNTILASGAVLLPTDITENLAMASLHHGTLINEADAPSYFKFETETTLASFMASTGIIVGMPDYVGYGASKNIDHPYEHYEGLGEPGADFVQAMIEMVKDEGVNWNEVLMLGGYSEGGYAAMATHKWIEENMANSLKVKVSVCGAGAYNKTATFKKLLNEGGSSELANNRSYIWVLRTYNEIYGLNKPMSYYFKEPYASEIESKGLEAVIETSLKETATDQFKDDVNNGNYPELLAAIAENDIFDWKPNAKVSLYHGTADDYVPFLNSETAFNAMTNKGANVSLSPIEDGTHGSTISSYFLGVLQEFSSNKGSSN
ncbi:alpha/beta hydrolase family protein [Arcticibacterium luteifluviistationis]|uniref:Phospholipase n=1 Tax=Arcticibacterium luteifluviistationis TaxID=1784714 RepID=A0A2Z4GHG1_9BACT|nr:lipase family protein [Arcticibacterium luteifluviistationis]AWW00508.1 phospholipase [Arcticibacterium luteifluviistationis]